MQDLAFNLFARQTRPRFSGKIAQNPCTALTGKCTEKLNQPPAHRKILSFLYQESDHKITDG
jgi:hypothetical protein